MSNQTIPKEESTSSRKNKHGLKLPEVPKESSEQNHNDNRYIDLCDLMSVLFFVNLVSPMSVF
jgi:hypothetical protein